LNKTVANINSPVIFFLLYAFTAGIGAVYNTFIPLYFQSIGFTGTMIGTLLAISPLMILISQPFWGTRGDRTRSINRLYRTILAGTTIMVACYPLTRNFYIVLVMIVIFSFFNSVMFTVQDVLVLQAIENTSVRYGTARMGSTIGFAVISIIAGVIINQNINLIFPLTAGFGVIAFLITYKIPNVAGHQTRENRVSPLVLFKNRELVILTALCFFVVMTLGYYSNFFSIYFKELGGNNSLLGVYWFISAIIEVPFLLLADRIVRKLTVRGTLVLAALVMAVRWLLLFLLHDVYAVMATGLMHGFSFIVIIYCMATFINREMPPELKSSGQSFFALLGGGLPRILASVIGGIANDNIGIRKVFLICAVINMLVVIIIGGLLFLRKKKPPTAETAA
jgi:MFS transporter, PPP family, 3-phenylpropionic acid transporter